MIRTGKKIYFLFFALVVFGCGGGGTDIISPGRILDLSVEEVGPDYVVLTWTAPGDNGYFGGPVARYDLRYSREPIVKETWETCEQVLNEGEPSRPGTEERYILRGLDIKTRYYFAIRSYDDVNNRSEISNVTQTVTLDAFGGSGTWLQAANPEPPAGSYMKGGVNEELQQIFFYAPPWTLLYNYSPSSSGWQQFSTSLTPPQRIGYVVMYLRAQNKYILFGGVTGDGTYVNSSYYFDPVTAQWAPTGAGGSIPPARAGTCAAMDENSGIFYIFGGELSDYSGVRYYNDVYSFDPSTNTWTYVNASPPYPPARVSAACAYIPSLNVFLIVGGRDNVATYGDIWVLDLNTSPPGWIQIYPDNAGPPPFYGAFAFHDVSFSRIVLTGGVTESGNALGSAWAMEYTSDLRIRWVRLKPEGTSPAVSVYDWARGDSSLRRIFYYSMGDGLLYQLVF